jgi:protein phosphatase
MGGAAAGEVASELAVNIVYEKLVDGDMPKDHDDLARRVVRSVEAAGLRIYSEAKLDRHHRGMGTTATVAALLDYHLYLGQVGDSRAYILRNEQLVQVTRDQSLVNQLIEAGQLTEEEAENFEHNNIILQALGTADTVQVDLTYVPLRRGDVLMLCSDGLSGMVRYEEIRHTLIEHPDALEACKILTDKANDAGGHDNVTVIVARFEGEGLPEPSDDDPPLRYTKYILPEDAGSEPTIPGRRGAVKELDEPKIGSEVKDRLTDHGPSRSKVAQTLIGVKSPLLDKDFEEARRRADDEEIVLPVENTPLWVLAALVVAVFGGLVFAAYYFIIKP